MIYFTLESYLFTENETKRTYVYAEADFVDKVTGEVQKAETERRIYLLPDGKFVFQWRQDSKMFYILTSNDGHYLSDGTGFYAFNRETPEKWSEKNSTHYKIANFKGIL